MLRVKRDDAASHAGWHSDMMHMRMSRRLQLQPEEHKLNQLCMLVDLAGGQQQQKLLNDPDLDFHNYYSSNGPLFEDSFLHNVLARMDDSSNPLDELDERGGLVGHCTTCV